MLTDRLEVEHKGGICGTGAPKLEQPQGMPLAGSSLRQWPVLVHTCLSYAQAGRHQDSKGQRAELGCCRSPCREERPALEKWASLARLDGPG